MKASDVVQAALLIAELDTLRADREALDRAPIHHFTVLDGLPQLQRRYGTQAAKAALYSCLLQIAAREQECQDRLEAHGVTYDIKPAADVKPADPTEP